jgi:hypothetical protein
MSGFPSRRVVLHRALAPLLVGGAVLFATGLSRPARALEPGPRPLGALWTDPYASLPQNGVAPSVDSPASLSLAQVSWPNFDSGNGAVESLGTAGSSDAYMVRAPTDDTSAQVTAESVGQVVPVAAPPFRPRPQAIRTRHAAGFWEDVPIPTALLIPVALGLALLVARALGPSGRPQPVGKRAGGLSRALDRRTGGGGDAI